MLRLLGGITFLMALSARAASAEWVEIDYLSCQVCHGVAGTDSSIPAIQGRPQEELLALLDSFATGAPEITIMHRFMLGTTDAERESLARYISQLKGPQP
jgi:cytochrome c553